MERASLGPAAAQRVAGCEPAHGERGVGERHPPGHIARRVDPAPGGGQVPVGNDVAVLVQADPGARQAQAAGNGLAAGSDQQPVRRHLLPGGQRQHHALFIMRNAGGRDPGADADPIGVEHLLEEVGHGRVGGGQQPGRGLDDRHLAAEPGERLRQLVADRAPAQDRQPARQRFQIEDSLVGQVLGLRQTRHRRDGGPDPVAITNLPARSHCPSILWPFGCPLGPLMTRLCSAGRPPQPRRPRRLQRPTHYGVTVRVPAPMG